MNATSKPKLMLLFTRGVSLKVWDRVGMLDRETELYKRLFPNFSAIDFLTYGDSTEFEYGDRLAGIEVLPNKWGLTPTRFSILAPLLLRKQFRNSDVIKTNQLDGAWTGVIATLVFRKKLIVRCGYLRWFSYQKLFGNGMRSYWVYVLEKLSFKLADACIVSAHSHKPYLMEVHGIPEKKIFVIPNAINTDVFRPMPEGTKEKGLVCFVGRLAPEKNLEILVEAVSGLEGVKLLLIGDGPCKEAVEKKAIEKNVEIEFHSRIPNYELPKFLNRAQVYAQPSSFEGCPKTLLEAMACELPVVGTDVEGIRDIIRNGENGILCDKSVAGIRNAIASLLRDSATAERIGRKAREYVHSHHSMSHVAEMELEIIRTLCGNS